MAARFFESASRHLDTAPRLFDDPVAGFRIDDWVPFINDKVLRSPS